MKKTGFPDMGPLTTVGKFRIYLDGLERRPNGAVERWNTFEGHRVRSQYIADKYSNDEVRASARVDAADAARILDMIRERVPNIDALVDEYKRQFPVR